MSRRVPTRWINHETTMSRNRFLTAISAHLTLITVALTEGSKPFFQNIIFERLPIDYHDAGIFDPDLETRGQNQVWRHQIATR